MNSTQSRPRRTLLGNAIRQATAGVRDATATTRTLVSWASGVIAGQGMWRPLMARAMTSCWICSVPSKMS